MSPGLLAVHTNRHRNVLSGVFPKNRGENNPARLPDGWIICIHVREGILFSLKKQTNKQKPHRETTWLDLENMGSEKSQTHTEHAMCVTHFMTPCIRNVLNRQSHRYKADGSPEAGRGGGSVWGGTGGRGGGRRGGAAVGGAGGGDGLFLGLGFCLLVMECSGVESWAGDLGNMGEPAALCPT